MGSEPPSKQPIDDDVYSAFHQYPWKTDQTFLRGLIALLGGVDKLHPTASHTNLAVHARVFYYRKIRGVELDFAGYESWLARLPRTDESASGSGSGSGSSSGASSSASQDKDILAALYWARDHIASIPGPPPPNRVHAVAAISQKYVPPPPTPTAAAAGGPAWQAAAPMQELQVSRSDVSGGGGDGDGSNAPYPTKFLELIAAVQANKPVPGVREIPDTVVRDPNIKPIGRMTAPKKPWEERTGAESSTEPAFSLDAPVDWDFPPLDDELEADSATPAPPKAETETSPSQ